MAISQRTVGILGLGQIGGSIGTRLVSCAKYDTVAGYDLRPELRNAAKQGRVATEITGSETELVTASDIVIVALPVGEIIAFLKRQQDRLKTKVAILDTGSVKREIMTTADQLRLVNFVGGHPLAGTEQRGPGSWNGDLFEAANFFLTRTSCTDPGAFTVAEEITRLLGAKPITVDPEQHDRLLAVTSHLSHLVAYAVLHTYRDWPETNIDKNLFRAPSFQSATRVADSDPEMVFQMLWHNRRQLAGGLTSFLLQLQSVQETLNNDNESGFRRFLDNSLRNGD